MNCKYIKSNGEQCGMKAIKGADLCFTHNPSLNIEKQLATSRGGLNRRLVEKYGDTIKLENANDIKILIANTINLIWSGRMPASQPANSIGFLARVFLDANEQSDLESRISVIEENLKKSNKVQ